MWRRLVLIAALAGCGRIGFDAREGLTLHQVSITDNGDEDWSFGYGRAQFLTGELK